MKRLNIILLFVIFVTIITKGQQPVQTIRGRVTDVASGAPLVYATVVIWESSPQLSSVTDSTGLFKISSVPIGRYNLQINMLGYEPVLVNEIQVLSGKENFLNISLKESTISLSEILVKPNVNKEKAMNSMAMVSSRMLSADEASRYAGGFDDPARLASSFAGVAGNIGNNGIVIRGNSPKSLQWKMEGVEIPNPNHFADVTVLGGGGLTALSVKMLGNSDFFTGAFPAEFNNALSGVFDIMMRNGNNQKHEHSFQLGIIGIEASSEGSVKKNGQSSYLINYRYSTMGLLKSFLPENGDGISYQDLSFKLHMPTTKVGVFTLWGIGLNDYSGQVAKVDSTEWEYISDKESIDVEQFMAATGINHQYFLNQHTYIKSTMATTIDGLDMYTQSLNNNLVLQPQNKIRNTNQTFVLSSLINKKFGSRHSNRTGFVATGMRYNLLLCDQDKNKLIPDTIVNKNGFSTLLSAYSNSSVSVLPNLIINIGLNSQYFILNGNYTFEPRLGLKWQINSLSYISMAYGIHSRLEKLNYYFTNTNSSSTQATNKNLDFAKAHHYVLGYDQKLSEFLHLKTEIYYQHLFNIPVIQDSSYSFINLQNDWFINNKLSNKGLGRNYGIDITLEQYQHHGYYYMVTASLFNSEYLGGDNIWRNTRFNRHYLFNILTGKEWQIGDNRQNTLGINIRLNFQGGDCYTPVNKQASIIAKDVVFNENEAFSQHLQPSFNIHFSFNYRINKAHIAHEFAFKCLNITMQEEFTDFQYNYIKHQVDERRDIIFIPNLSYKVEF